MNNEMLRQRLLSIKQMVNECLESLGYSQDDSVLPASDTHEATGIIEDMSAAIANKVGECEDSNKLKKLLDKPTPDSKVLLCLYISYKYFDKQWLTSGQIAKATAELGIKIDQGQASNKIKEMRRYIESGSARKRGQPTPYRLNRQGLQHFEEMMNA